VLTALMNAGYREEAVAWRQWLHRAIAGTPDQLQIMYGIRGERRMHEHELPWLPGYENSAPVRIGNAAADQFQLDVYGELAGAFDHGRRTGIFDPDPIAEDSDGSDSMQVLFLNHLASIWDRPDEGIWEIRGESKHFVHSKVMAWLAFRRAADQPRSRIAARFQDSWAELADRIHADICAKGVDPDGNHFVQSYGSKELDASLLVVTLSGFLPEDDPRVVNTVRAIEQRLMVKGLVKRYNTFSGIDGLEPGEGMFLPCSFWLVENYVMLGRMDDARTLFAKLVALCNDVGLLAEEYDPVAGRQLGNFPQAFSHVALVNAAYSITHAKSSISRTHEPDSHD
jgi:GH15 family glucan-1,4-alpha-glucosidase